VSSGEDDVPKTNASSNKRKAPYGDDVEDKGVSSAKPIAPNPIMSNVLEQAGSSITDQTASIVPPASGCGRKRSTIAVR
jgi:hypothetical protein